jgi:uncharacterized protein YbaR (Trm112 family)
LSQNWTTNNPVDHVLYGSNKLFCEDGGKVIQVNDDIPFLYTPKNRNNNDLDSSNFDSSNKSNAVFVLGL